MKHNANQRVGDKKLFDDRLVNDRLVATLKLAGLKATVSRLLVFELFSHGCKPLNADFIFKKITDKKINQVTVYRTLASLETAGAIKRVDLRKGSAFYELNTRGVLGHGAIRHHHHIVCADCGKTESFKNCDIDKVSEKILKKSPLFKTINEHSLELFGTCKSCAK